MALQKTYYQILSVANSAPDHVIRAAFKSLTQKHHPDLNPEDATAHAKMTALNQAYAVLSDPDKRNHYDFLLEQEARLIADHNTATNLQTSKTKTHRGEALSLATLTGTMLSIGCLAFISLFTLQDPQVAFLRNSILVQLNQLHASNRPTDWTVSGRNGATNKPSFADDEPSHLGGRDAVPFSNTIIDSDDWTLFDSTNGLIQTGFVDGKRLRLTGDYNVVFSNIGGRDAISAKLIGFKNGEPRLINRFMIRRNESFAMKGLENRRYEVQFQRPTGKLLQTLPVDLRGANTTQKLVVSLAK